jgi:hypothetical protein
MKTFIKILSIFFFAGAFILSSCEREDKIYDGKEFIHFGGEELQYKESYPDTITMPVYLAGKLPNQDVTVSYSIKTSAVDSTASVDTSDYKIVEPKGGSFTFKKGNAVQEFKILVYDNIETDKNKMVTVTLDNASNYVMGLPGSEAKKSFTLTISDDDCPFVAENFVGKPEGTDLIGSGIDGNSQMNFTLNEKISDNVAEYHVSGMMMPLLDYYNEEYDEKIDESYPVSVTLDNSDPKNPSVTIKATRTDQLIYYTHDPSATWQYYMYESTTAAYGSSFSTCNRSIDAYYVIETTKNEAPPTGNPDNFSLMHFNVTFTSDKSVEVKDIKVSKVDLTPFKDIK